MWKDAKAVLVPTNEKSNLYKVENTLYNYVTGVEREPLNCDNQYLYIVGDDEIKFHHYFYDPVYKRIFRCNEVNQDSIRGTLNFNELNTGSYHEKDKVQKIIATNDKRLKIVDSTKSKINGVECETFVGEEFNLPLIPISFLTNLVDEFNFKKTNIIDVKVKYNDIVYVQDYVSTPNSPLPPIITLGGDLKLDSNKFINIKFKHKNDVVYSVDEAKKMCMDANAEYFRC